MLVQLADVAVHAAAGRVEDSLRARRAHRLDDVERKRSPLPEVDARVAHGGCDVGIRREVDHDVVSVHRLPERLEVGHVAAHNRETFVTGMVFVVPCTAGREVVEQGDAADGRVGEQAVGKMASDEAGASDDDPPSARHRRAPVAVVDSHFVACRCSAGWLTRRCQITAHRPSV